MFTNRKKTRGLVLALGAACALGLLLFLFWRESPFEERSLETRAGLAPGYVIEDGAVYWRPMDSAGQLGVRILTLGVAADAPSVQGWALKQADPATFVVMTPEYGKDAKHVWWRGERLAQADPESFLPLEQTYSRDRSTLWRDADPVMSLKWDDVLRVWSARVVSLNHQAWLIGTPSMVLPEMPEAAPTHHCGDWFVMNGALWHQSQRLRDVADDMQVVACQGAVACGAGSLLFLDGRTLWRARSDGEPQRLLTLPQEAKPLRLMTHWSHALPLLVAQADDGRLMVTRVEADAPVQQIAASAPGAPMPVFVDETSLWFDGRYFTRATRADALPLRDHGLAKKLGDYALTDEGLFYAGRLVAQPGQIPVEAATDGIVVIGSSCMGFGHYVSDLLEGEAPLSAGCDGMRSKREILYEGLTIGFRPAIRLLGEDEHQPAYKLYELGEVYVENRGNEPRLLSAQGLAGLRLEVEGVSLTPGFAVKDDVMLPPGEGLVARPSVSSDDDPLLWGWRLWMQHTEARARIFGEKPFSVGHGNFTD